MEEIKAVILPPRAAMPESHKLPLKFTLSQEAKNLSRWKQLLKSDP